VKHLLNITAADLSAEIKALGQSDYRARQIEQWVWAKGVTAFGDMTNLSAALRDQLAEHLCVLSGRVVNRRDASDGVVKLLIEWPDGEQIETVLIPADGRRTACVSTQAGCAIGCAFCASGLGGLRRNLTAGEIIEQTFQLNRLQAATGEKITHVVVMGMGEPLANYDATLTAVRAWIDPERGAMSARHISVSTVGLPAAMRRLAGEGIPLTLAISLHAPNDQLRKKLIPAAPCSIAELIDAGREYFQRTGRELTLEYILLGGVNDSLTCAAELATVARQLRCNVNLIRYNPVESLPYKRPDERHVRSFRDKLGAAGVNVQIRASRGTDADAACGQLRARETES